MIKVNMKSFNLSGAAMKQRAALGLFADTAAKKMEGQAKVGAKWIDRTSNARNSIQGDFGWEGNKLKVILSGGMDYSVYLELAHEKKYAILKPTIDKNASSVISGYKKLVKD
jgi:hypothetical protein